MKTFLEIMNGVEGCTIANVTYVTDGGIPQKVLGKGYKVTRITKLGVQLNFSYENAVNNRLVKAGEEANFKTEDLKWGAWLDGYTNKVITYKGKLYLRFYQMKNNKGQHLWLVNGQSANAEQFAKIMAYLSTKDLSSKRQTEAGLVENQVMARTLAIDNIISLRVNDCEWSATKTEAVVTR